MRIVATTNLANGIGVDASGRQSGPQTHYKVNEPILRGSQSFARHRDLAWLRLFTRSQQPWGAMPQASKSIRGAADRPQSAAVGTIWYGQELRVRGSPIHPVKRVFVKAPRLCPTAPDGRRRCANSRSYTGPGGRDGLPEPSCPTRGRSFGAHVCAPQQIGRSKGVIFCVILPDEG